MSGLNKFFDKIYCINLDRRKDRWRESLVEFELHDLSDYIHRFPAIDGNTLNNTHFINNGELGLIMTHEKILREAIEHNYSSILILEDDIVFSKTLQSIDLYFEALPRDWEMLWLGANHNIHCGNVIRMLNNRIIKCHQAFSTHAIAFNNLIYKKALKCISNKEKALDVYYSDMQNTQNCYAFHPSMALQRPSYSDIQNKKQDNRWLF